VHHAPFLGIPEFRRKEGQIAGKEAGSHGSLILMVVGALRELMPREQSQPR